MLPQVLALELLKIVLDGCGPTFRNSERFLSAIRQYLCLSLLKNSASSVSQALQLCCAIFTSLMTKFRCAAGRMQHLCGLPERWLWNRVPGCSLPVWRTLRCRSNPAGESCRCMEVAAGALV